MDVHPPKNGINRYWSIPICLLCRLSPQALRLHSSSDSPRHHVIAPSRTSHGFAKKTPSTWVFLTGDDIWIYGEYIAGYMPYMHHTWMIWMIWVVSIEFLGVQAAAGGKEPVEFEGLDRWTSSARREDLTGILTNKLGDLTRSRQTSSEFMTPSKKKKDFKGDFSATGQDVFRLRWSQIGSFRILGHPSLANILGWSPMTAGEWSSMKFSPHPWDYSACTATMHCAMSGLSGMRKIWSRSLGVPGSRLHWWRSFQGRPGIGGSQVIHPKDVKNLYGMAMMVWEGTKQTPGSWICSSWFTMFDLFASSLHAAHNVMDQGASTSWNDTFEVSGPARRWVSWNIWNPVPTRNGHGSETAEGLESLRNICNKHLVYGNPLWPRTSAVDSSALGTKATPPEALAFALDLPLLPETALPMLSHLLLQVDLIGTAPFFGTPSVGKWWFTRFWGQVSDPKIKMRLQSLTIAVFPPESFIHWWKRWKTLGNQADQWLAYYLLQLGHSLRCTRPRMAWHGPKAPQCPNEWTLRAGDVEESNEFQSSSIQNSLSSLFAGWFIVILAFYHHFARVSCKFSLRPIVSGWTSTHLEYKRWVRISAQSISGQQKELVPFWPGQFHDDQRLGISQRTAPLCNTHLLWRWPTFPSHRLAKKKNMEFPCPQSKHRPPAALSWAVFLGLVSRKRFERKECLVYECPNQASRTIGDLFVYTYIYIYIYIIFKQILFQVMYMYQPLG